MLALKCITPTLRIQGTSFGLRGFSEYFSNLDRSSMFKYDDKYYANVHYEKMQRKWQVPLERKRKKKERKIARLENVVKRSPEDEKLVVHSAEQGITLPADPNKIFAILEISGTQYKVLKDDKLLCDKLPFEVGNRIEFDKILLIGTKDYTSVGRPYVESAKVIASVEEQTRTKKIIIYKKKRRDGYQRNQGHRQDITVLHIEDIFHQPSEETLTQYSYI